MTGVLSRIRESGRHARAVQRTESFRLLRTNLEVALLDLDPPTVVVTSAMPGEGKSSTCAQLGLALATAGRRVLIVDADLRHPDQHAWFGLDATPGMSDVLLGDSSPEDALSHLNVGRGSRGIYVLPAGHTVPNPTELLTSPRMARLLEVLGAQADIVLVDSPPVLPVADALVLGRLAAGVLLVVESRVTQIDQARAARDALVRNQSRVLGVVVNKVQGADAAAGYGYGYGSSALPTDPVRLNGADVSSASEPIIRVAE